MQQGTTLKSEIIKLIESNSPEVQGGLATLGYVLTQVGYAVREFVRQNEPLLKALSEVNWEDVSRRLEAMPDLSKKAVILASSKGWFFSMNDSLEEVLMLIENLDDVNLDEEMARYWRKNLDAVEIKLCQRYPDRSTPITAAFAAHKSFGNDGYFLSIPVFIAQADGLLAEILNINSQPMSISRDKNSKISKETNAANALRARGITELDSHGLLHQIYDMHNFDLIKSKIERKKTAESSGKPFSALNRHQVMHGECCDYGNEINSLKAFSLLAFVGVDLAEMIDGKKYPS